jgi:hypothetical protein
MGWMFHHPHRSNAGLAGSHPTNGTTRGIMGGDGAERQSRRGCRVLQLDLCEAMHDGR